VTASDRPIDADTASPPSRAGAFLALAAAVTAWGIGWPVNRGILYYLPPFSGVALRSALATAALFAVAAWRRRLILPARRDVPVVLSIALLHMVGFAALVSFGLLFVPVGRSAVLAYTTPLWVTPGAALFLGERLSWPRTGGVVLGIAGLAVLFNPLAFDWHDGGALFGNGVLLAAAVLWAASILHIRAHRWQAPPFDLIPWEMALATAVLGTLALLIDGWRPIEWTPTLVALLLYSALPGTVLAYWGAAVASRDLPAVTTSLGLLAAPVIGIAASAVALGEAPTLPLAIAVALIVGGIALGATASATLQSAARSAGVES
jgi:drug/metabolite transporter (DMT)-like permease